jgi:hypothetical protein
MCVFVVNLSGHTVVPENNSQALGMAGFEQNNRNRQKKL